MSMPEGWGDPARGQVFTTTKFCNSQGENPDFAGKFAEHSPKNSQNALPVSKVGLILVPSTLRTECARRFARGFLLLGLAVAGSTAFSQNTAFPPEAMLLSAPMLETGIDRPLRYHPDGTDFVIENGNGVIP